MLIVHSNGGSIEPAYLIGKTLKRLSDDKFIVAVPRKAKSAATLIALGADEIHMGLLSQLGPIDPQVGNLPALALGNALESIAELVCKHEKSSDMFARYLTAEIPIRLLGYFNRIGESAIQYAERLIGKKSLGDNMNASELAKHLVNYYKDHGFVIDIDESKSLLGDNILKSNTTIYQAADEIFNLLDFVRLVSDENNKTYWYVGDAADGPTIMLKTKD